MDTLQEINDWTISVVNDWNSKGIELGQGISLDVIEKTELHLSFDFPESFKELYKKVNGWSNMAWNEHMFCIWSLDRIIEEYEYMRHPDFIGFCDYLINSHYIGFVRGEAGIFKRYDLEGHSNPKK